MKAKYIVTQSDSLVDRSYRGSDENAGLDLTLTVAIAISILSAIAILLYVSKSKRRHGLFSPKVPHAVCDRCEYFSDSHLLRCALHPSTVLTKEATNCMDYKLKTKSD